MVKHYLLIAVRNIVRQKTPSLINLLGLSLGLSSALLLIAFIYNQNLKDQGLTEIEQYVRLEGNTSFLANEGFQAKVHPGIARALTDNLPAVEQSVRMNALTLDIRPATVQDRNTSVSERFLKADQSFFELFPQQLLEGTIEAAFHDRNTVIITEGVARRLFGEENPIGKQIKTSQGERSLLTVVGIVKDSPKHSSIRFGCIFATDYNYDLSSGGFSATSIYLKISPKANKEELTEDINRIVAQSEASPYVKSFTYRISDFAYAKYDLSISDEVVIPTDKSLLAIFTLIAVFILALAIVNYINLSVAQALRRAKEAGIRKMMGAGRGSYFYQFVTESVLMSLIALPAALVLFVAAQPYFEQALAQPLAIDSIKLPLVGLSILLVLFTGLVSGVYPALIISRIEFREFISGNLLNNHKTSPKRSALIVFQFTVALTLIICALIVHQQLQFAQAQKLAYEPEQIIVLNTGLSTKFPILQSELSRLPGVKQVSLTSSPPGGDNHASSGPMKKITEVAYLHKVDHNYAEILNLEFISGENFSKGTEASDNDGVIINETLAAMIKAANPQNLANPLEGSYVFKSAKQPIRGVVRDFHIESMHERIKPMIFVNSDFKGYTGAKIMLEIETTEIAALLENIEETWFENVPISSFNYTFLDERFKRLYTLETRLSQIFNVFTGIALVISCLGLYGLIAFIVAAKMKEIAIRKVLGATVDQIVGLFSGNICLLLLLASLVSVPLAWWSMSTWLQDFAYHISISWLTILGALALVFFTGGLTVVFRVVRSARISPAESLRSE